MRELIDAVKRGQTDEVRKILKKQNPANLKNIIDEVDEYDNARYTAVCWAAEKGYLSIIELLIIEGVNLQYVTGNQYMNVHQIAKFYGHNMVAKVIADNLLLQVTAGKCGEAMIDYAINEGANPLFSNCDLESGTAIDFVARANISENQKSNLICKLAAAALKIATDEKNKKELLALIDKYKNHIKSGNFNDIGVVCASLQDYTGAVYWFQRSVLSTESNNNWGKRNLAIQYIYARDAIKRNLPEAMKLLVEAYDSSVKQNLAYSSVSSIEQIKVIADMQNLSAADEIAARDNARKFLVKINLEKTPPDFVEAEKYFNLVNEKEKFQPYADYFMALKLLKRNIEKNEEPDVVSAIEVLNKLAVAKLNVAKLKLEELAGQDKDLIAKNLAKIALYAVTRYEKYVLKDKPWVDYFNGICALNGWQAYPVPDIVEAANLFERAAQQGVMVAHIRLAECLEHYPSNSLQSTMRAVGENAVKSVASDAVYVLKRTQRYLSATVADLKADVKADVKADAPKLNDEPVHHERIAWLEKAIDLQKRSNNENDKSSLAANLHELANLLRKSNPIKAFACFKQAAELKHLPSMIEVANAYYLGWYNYSGIPAIDEAVSAHQKLIHHYSSGADWVNVDVWHNKLLKLKVLADTKNKNLINEISLDILNKKIAFNQKAARDLIDAANADGVLAYENSLLNLRLSVSAPEQKAIDDFILDVNIRKIAIYKNKINFLIKAEQLDQVNIEINKLKQLKNKVDAQHQNEIDDFLMRLSPYISKLLQKRFVNLPTAEISKHLFGQLISEKMAAEAVLLDRAKQPDAGAAAALIQFYEEQAHQKEAERDKLLGKAGDEANVSAENKWLAEKCQLDAVRFFHLAAELGSVYSAERISDYAEPFEDNWEDTQQLTLARRTLTESPSVQFATQLKEQVRQKAIARLSIGFEAKFDDLCKKAVRTGNIGDVESIAIALFDEKLADSHPFLKKIPYPEIKVIIMHKAMKSVADVCAAQKKKNIFDRISYDQHKKYIGFVSWDTWNTQNPDLAVAHHYYRTLAMAGDIEAISRYAIFLYANPSFISYPGMEFYWSYKACVLGDESQRLNLQASAHHNGVAEFFLSLITLEKKRAFKAEGVSDPDMMILLELSRSGKSVCTDLLQAEMRDYAAKKNAIAAENSTAVSVSAPPPLYPVIVGASLASSSDAKSASVSSQAQVYQLLPQLREGVKAALSVTNKIPPASAPELEVAEPSEGVVRDVVNLPPPPKAISTAVKDVPVRKLAFA